MPQPGLAQVAADPAPDTAATADNSADSGEILVTAQRREERARDVPLTITQITGAQMQDRGITNTAQLAQLTPGLRIERTGSYTQPALRGISSTLTSAGSDSPVAIYVDGIYQQSLAGLTFELPDVKSVDVLKGPQGTLFGRNATGGAIQISTLDPQQTFSGKMFASYGNFNDVVVNAYVTGPLADNVAFSLSGAVHNNDGYLHDLVSGGSTGRLKSHLVRGKLMIEPTSQLKIKLTGFYSLRNDGTSGGQPLNGNSQARNEPGVILPLKPYDYAGNFSTTNVKNYGGSLDVELETEIGTITALTGYTKWNIYAASDADRVYLPNGRGSAANPYQLERGASQEVNFASKKFGALSFIAGVFYYDGYGLYQPQQIRQNFPTVSNTDLYSKQPIKAGAIFGEVTFDATDRLTFIGGLRYSTEKRRFSGIIVPADAAPPATLPLLGKRHDTGVTPRASVRYKLTDESNLYFTFSKGFKSGSFNSSVATLPAQTVAPEKVTAYEVGSKSRFGSFDLNVAGYYYKYTDLQVSASQLINGQVLQRIQNAASARIYGLEVESGVTLLERLRLSVGLSLLNAKYTNFPNATINVPRPGNNGNLTLTQDVTGNRLNRAPAMTLNVTGQYTADLAGGELRLSSSVYYSSHYFFEANNRIVQPSYVLIDGRIAWTPPNSDVTFAVFGTNLTDKQIFRAAFPSSAADGVSYAPPRTYGVSVGYKF